MTVDRKKFKATPMNKIKEQETEYEKVAPKPPSFNKDFANYLKIEKGTNKFRIFPAHKESTTFIYPKCTSWISKEVQVDDGKGGKKTEIKRGPVFNARVHAPEGANAKDIIEEYVRIATEQLTEQIKDEDKLQKELAKMTFWKTGLLPKSNWVVYAQKYVNGKKEFGLLELSYTLKEQLNTLSAVEESDEPVATDPFTDPDSGKAIIITMNEELDKKGNKRTKYTAAIEFRGDYALTDEELTELDSYESLELKFKNCYTKKTFEAALQGLQIFDEENDFYIFNNEDFKNVIDELADLYPDAEETDTEEATVDLDSLDRNALKAYIKEKGLVISLRAGLSEDDIRNMIRDAEGTETAIEESHNTITDGPATDIDEMLNSKPGLVAKKEEVKKSSALDDVKKKLGGVKK